VTDSLAIDVIEAQAGPLSMSEQKKLVALEKKLEQYWVCSYVEIGTVLAEIKRAKLYRDTHETWPDYCHERWGIGGNYADKQIRAANAVAGWIGTDVPVPPFEAQARVLTRVKDEGERRDTWVSMVERHGGPPTVEIMEAELPARAPKPRPTKRLVKAATRTRERPAAEQQRQEAAEWAGDLFGPPADFDLPDSDEGTSDFDPLAFELEQVELHVGKVHHLLYNGAKFADEDLPRWYSVIESLSEAVSAPTLVDA
jgi:hypothetical protein